jgi:hypothetical protein
MRPLIAHCHHGLGRLHQLAGAHQQAAKHFMTAAAMYRELDMPFWIKRAEAQRRP